MQCSVARSRINKGSAAPCKALVSLALASDGAFALGLAAPSRKAIGVASCDMDQARSPAISR